MDKKTFDNNKILSNYLKELRELLYSIYCLLVDMKKDKLALKFLDDYKTIVNFKLQLDIKLGKIFNDTFKEASKIYQESIKDSRSKK